MVKKASGFDVIKAVVDLTLGGKPRVADIRKRAGLSRMSSSIVGRVRLTMWKALTN